MRICNVYFCVCERADQQKRMNEVLSENVFCNHAGTILALPFLF